MRRLATSSRSGSLAHNEAALDQDEGGNGPRRGSVMREPGRQPGSTGVMGLRGVGAVQRDGRVCSRRG